MCGALIGAYSEWRTESILSLPARWRKITSSVEVSCSCKSESCSSSTSFLPYVESPKHKLLIESFFSLFSAQLSFENVNSWFVSSVGEWCFLLAFLTHKRQKLLANQSTIDTTMGQGISEHERELLVQTILLNPDISSSIFVVRTWVKETWMQVWGYIDIKISSWVGGGGTYL